MNDLLTSAGRMLWRKPGRTLLALFSLAAGVAMLTALAALSQAGMHAAETEFRAMGLDGFSLSATEGTFNRNDLLLLSSHPSVSLASPLSVLPATAVLAGKPQDVLLCGVDEHAADAIAVELDAGRMPNRQDVASKALCCTVEQSVAASFGKSNPITGTVCLTVNGREFPFTVIGTARAKSTLLQNLTDTVPPLFLVPYSTLTALSGNDTFDRILLRSSESADQLTKRLTVLFSDHVAVKLDSVAVQKERLTRLLSLLGTILTACGCGAVLVAGCSILLTQLSAVSERMAEIGLKKALGATRARILAEFLVSAALLSFYGAISGVTVGSAVAAIGLSLGKLIFMPSVPTVLLLVFGTTAFGTLCGVYPAAKAARLSPLDAFCRA